MALSAKAVYAILKKKIAAVSGSVAAIEIPTKLSQLTGDSMHRTVTDAEKEAWSAVADVAADGIKFRVDTDKKCLVAEYNEGTT